MNGDELVWDCLRKHGTDEEGRRCLQHCGADKELQEILREFDAEETQTKARQLLRKFAVDEAMEKARCRKAALDSIEDSPVWKDPRVLTELSQRFMAKDLEKSRETTKHYIDSAKHSLGPKSQMGQPKRGADGQVLRDANGRVIWDTSAQSDIEIAQFDPTSVHLGKASQGSLKNCGQCAHYNQDKTCQIVTGPISADLTCDKFMAIPAKPVSLMTADGKIDPNKSLMGTPKVNADGSISWEVNDEPKPQPVNVRADGKIDATKSIMGQPKRNPDGSTTWT